MGIYKFVIRSYCLTLVLVDKILSLRFFDICERSMIAKNKEEILNDI
jgi:hypothetical protein